MEIIAPITLAVVLALYLGVYVPWHEKQEDRPARRAKPEGVVDLALCESSRLMLRPDQLYRFRAHAGCRECAKIAEVYSPNTADEPRAAKTTDTKSP